MSKTIEFIFDFGSPNAYLSHRVLPGIAERQGATIKLTPCLLGGIFKLTGNQAPMMAFANVKGKLAYDRVEMARFIAKHHLVKFRLNPHFPVNTLLLMRGLVAAQHLGIEQAYLETALCAMWEDGIKMDDPEEFVKAFDRVGLEGQAILEKTQDPTVKAELMTNTEAAATRGVFGIPTFFVGDEMFFGKDRLDQLEDYLATL